MSIKLKSNKRDILLSAIKLNIFELNYEFSSPKLGSAQSIPFRGYKAKPLYIHLFLTLFYLIRSALKHLLIRKKREQINDIVFFAVGIKHLWALDCVAKKVPNSCIIDPSDGLSVHFSPFKIRLYSLLFIPLILKQYFYSDGYEKRSFLYVFDNYLKVYGKYIVMRYFFQNQAVKAIVVANHYSPACTTILKAANDENIKTFYIQHAQVGEDLPDLKMDYVLLDGLDALEKYNGRVDMNSKVFLVGMAKMDPFFEFINRNENLSNLGICINSIDNYGKVENLIKAIKFDFSSLHVTLRPHPGDPDLKKWERMSRKYSLTYSNPLKEEAFKFLSNVDVIIVGDSSIALEAALLNVYPIYYDFSGLYLDYYCYIKNGLIDKHTNSYRDIRKWIVDFLECKPNIRKKTKRYCITVGTAFDGKSSELAAKLITDLCFENTFSRDQWRKIDNTGNLEAYRFYA